MMIAIAGGITGFTVIRSFRVEIQFTDTEATAKAKLSEFLESENNNHYKVLGFEWKMER